MKLDHLNSSPSQARGDATSMARLKRLAKPPELKYKRREDGTLVKLRRVRRKKPVAEVANPQPVTNGRRVFSTSELGKAAPVQTKPDAIHAKKGRYRSITPGTANLVIKANPSNLRARAADTRPLNTLDTLI